MKKIFTLVLLSLIACTSTFAAGHFSILGIEINGTQADFKRKMLKLDGMRYDNNTYDIWVYYGKFEGMSETEFYVTANDNTYNVYKVTMYMPEQSSWNALKNRYMTYFNRLKNHSGLRMESSTTGFDSPYREGAGNELEGVSNGDCNYESAFYNGQVYITLRISMYKQIQLSIYDLANTPSSFDFRSYYNSSASNTTNVFGTVNSAPASSSNSSQISSGSSSLTFLGLPVYGTAQEFANRLVSQKDCRISSDSNIQRIGLKGNFAGFKDCDIFVNEKPGTGQIYQLRVFLPEKSTWAAIKQQYLYFKNLYDAKYTCTQSVTTFSGSYREGDGNEIQAIENGNVDYRSEYTTSWGSITVSITKFGVRAEYNITLESTPTQVIDPSDL